ncbi:MAG TPA: NAD(P)/FAD-dependent oxidoreductase [Protaetiibacter sp.]|nr:NAD(P)/FAD-dependent oxidoreductase [Protaetiibacter sp.]
MSAVTASSTLFSPIDIGRLRVPNRIVMAPVDSVFRSVDGESNEQHREYLAARARGGVGLIISDNLVVDYPRGSVGSRAARIDQDRFVASLNDLVEHVHLAGGLIAAQINHAGRQTTLGGSQGLSLVSASAIPWADSGTVPLELSRVEVRGIIEAYRSAAARAKQAGFDAVQVHAAHGYLLASFLSPALNNRTDEFGGSTENRTRIVRIILEEIKATVGADYPIIVRINCDDGLPGGIRAEEAAQIAALLEQAGADAIDVSAGTYEQPQLTYAPMMYPQGVLMDRIAQVRQAVSVPVIGVGKIQTPEFAEQCIVEGKVDMVALGRTLIADPEWAAKAREGRVSRIRPCIACNHACIHRIDQNLTMRCNVNPELGRERATWIGMLSPARRRKRAVVVGGGPAGAEFALRADALGEQVVLFEESERLGGQLRIAGIPDFKADLRRLVAFYETQLASSNVEVRLGQRAELAQLQELEPDLVVFATGGQPARPFPGSETMPSYLDLFEGRFTPERSVTVFGGGPVGCELAVHLARAGNAVTIVEQDTELARSEDPSVRIFFGQEFERYGVRLLTGHRVRSVEGGVAVLTRLADGTEITWRDDSFVLAAGVRPEREVADALSSRFRSVVIGDARRVASVYDATQQAYHEVREFAERGGAHG